MDEIPARKGPSASAQLVINKNCRFKKEKVRAMKPGPSFRERDQIFVRREILRCTLGVRAGSSTLSVTSL